LLIDTHVHCNFYRPMPQDYPVYEGDPEYEFAVEAINKLRSGCQLQPFKDVTIYDDECYSSIVDSAQWVSMSLEVYDGVNPNYYDVVISSAEAVGDIGASKFNNTIIEGNYALVGIYDENEEDVRFCENRTASSRRGLIQKRQSLNLLEKNDNVKPRPRYSTTPVITETMWSEVPKDWDWRNAMPSEKYYASTAVASTPLSQGSCGSCYVFGGITAMSYRFNIQSNGTVNAVPSPRVVMTCANGCNGGSFDMVYSAMKSSYIPSIVAEAYNETVLDRCAWEKPESIWLKARDFSNIDDPSMPVGDSQPFFKAVLGERAMMYEVFKNGPGGVYVKVEDQFQSYSSDTVLEDKKCTRGADGVTCVYTSADTNHACTLIGWGVDQGKKYWLVRSLSYSRKRAIIVELLY
jgi:hypothetical protein